MSAGQFSPQPGFVPPEPPERSTTETFLRVCRAVVWVVYAIVIANVIMLTLAFLLRLFGANPDAGFTEWVYRSVERTMAPFRGIFPDRAIGDASVFDTSLLFAAIVYIIVALLIDALLRWLSGKVTAERRATVDAANREAAYEQAEAREAARQQAIRQQQVAQQQAAQQQATRQQRPAGDPWGTAPGPPPGADPWGSGSGG